MNIALPTAANLNSRQREVFNLFPINLTRGLVMTNSAKPYLSLGLSLRDGGLPPQARELVILRVGAVTGAQYEIHHHVPEARRVGVPADVMDAVLLGSVTFGDERIDALIGFVDGLLTGIVGAPADAVQRFYSGEEIAEIVLLVEHYVMTALFFKTLGITPEGEDTTRDVLADATDKLCAEQGRS